MNDTASAFVTTWFPFFFPVFFVGIWLFVTTLLGVLSGWFALQHRYPAANEEPLVRRKVSAASMGLGVSYRGMITIAACPSGLRVSTNRIMAPFQRAFVVPWREIETEEAVSFFLPIVRLRFGRPEVGKLTVGARDWAAVADYADANTLRAGRLKVEPAPTRAIVTGLVVQWLIAVAGAGSFFLVASRAQQPPGLPILVCYAFPAVVFGVGQAIRGFSQLR